MPTMDNTPGFINSVEGAPLYDATGLRLLDTVDLLTDGDALSARAGVRPSSVEGFEPYVAGGTYTVAPGVAVVSKESDGAQGGYRVALSQAVIENVPAADAVNARKDVIYLRVFDNDVDGLGLREGQVVYDAGTPASVPSRPAVPADALHIADVDVPAAGQGNPTLVDRRVYTVASGGILPTSVRPASPYVGQAIYRRDTDEVEVYRAGGWRVVDWKTVRGFGAVTGGKVPSATVIGSITVDVPESGMSAIVRWTGATGFSSINTDNALVMSCNNGTFQAGTDTGPGVRANGGAWVSFAWTGRITNLSPGPLTVEIRGYCTAGEGTYWHGLPEVTVFHA